MSALFPHPAALPLPPAAITRILARHPRERLEAFVTVAIDLMDALDPDPEAEITDAEDDFADHGQRRGHGPGCEIADAGENALIEWHTLPASWRREPNIAQAHEDEENDDPAGQYDEDCYTAPLPASAGGGAGCPIADPGELEDGL